MKKNRKSFHSKTVHNDSNLFVDDHDVLKKNWSCAQVISRFGEQADLSFNHQIYRCHIRKHNVDLTVGDWVYFQQDNDQDMPVIEKIKKRKNELYRIDQYHRKKTIVANVDKVCIVIAVEPQFSMLNIDKYLINMEYYHLPVMIIVNKIDLITQEQLNALKEELKIYQDIGYQILYLSIHKPDTLIALQQYLEKNITIFIGQSGVGKSSIVNQFIHHPPQKTQQLSENNKLGQHTTTVSRLFYLSSQGGIIDSPGIRDFLPIALSPKDILNGYIELQQYAYHCKFRDCQHQNESGCAVQSALKEGKISQIRIDNLLKIIKQIHNT